MSRLPKIDGAVIRARLEAGEFNGDLAREYGVHRSAISHAARRSGYDWRKVIGRQTKIPIHTKITRVQRDDIVKRVSAREKQITLAREYGLSRSRVSQIVKQYGSPRVLPVSRAGDGVPEVSSLPSGTPISHSREVL